MITLAINTASRTTAIALLEGNELLRGKSWSCQNNEAETLIPAIESLLNPLSYNDLDNILVINGPGSFTGLRVGVTAANTIAYLTKKKLYSIDTFQLYHANSALPILVFAGRGALYFSAQNKAPQIIKMTEINQFLQDKNITEFSGEITQDQADQINAKFNPSSSSPELQILTAYLQYKNQLKPQSIIKPNYVKDAGIHIKKHK